MDYILFGVGYGATLMLMGWLLRTFGPSWKYANVAPDAPSVIHVQRRFWHRFIQGLGGLFAILGTVITGFTILVILIDPDDGTGVAVTLGLWGVAIVATLGWCWLYTARFGVAGVWRRGYGYRSVPSSTAAATPLRGRQAVTPRQTVSEEITEPKPGVTVNPESDTGQIEETAESLEPEDADDTDGGYDFGESGDTTLPGEAAGREEALLRLQTRQAGSSSS